MNTDQDLTECAKIIQEVAQALDNACVPHVSGSSALAERIGLLVQQRDAQGLGGRSEVPGIRALSERLDDLIRVLADAGAPMNALDQKCGAAEGVLTDAGASTSALGAEDVFADVGASISELRRGVVWLARSQTERADALVRRIYEIMQLLSSVGIDTHVTTVGGGVSQLIRECAQLRRMHEGVSIDLHRERCEGQEALNEAAARELKLTKERDAANQDVERYKHAIEQHAKALATPRPGGRVIKRDFDKRCVQIADTIVPQYRSGKKGYSCTGTTAKRWQAAFDGACIALGRDPKKLLQIRQQGTSSRATGQNSTETISQRSRTALARGREKRGRRAARNRRLPR